jgi:hypothetical protein
MGRLGARAKAVLLGALLASLVALERAPRDEATWSDAGATALVARANAPAPRPSAPATATLGPAGGEIALERARLHVPEGALRVPTSITMAGTPLPAPLEPGYRAASPVVRLTKPTEERFAKPVLVTLPVDDATPLDRTVALYWDPKHELYRTLTVVRRDEAARTVTFETVHFTDFLVAGPDGKLPPLPNVDTGFRPQRDGFFFQNGDYDSDGTCLGMSLLSTWYFETHEGKKDAPSLHDLLESFHPVADQADLVGREMALAAQSAAVPPGEYWAKPSLVALDEAKAQGPVKTGIALIEALQATKTPQLIVINGPAGGHAIVAFAYQDGVFSIYDPNYPLTTQQMKFDREKGFYGWTGTDLGQPMDVAPVSFSSYAGDVDFEKIFDKALADRGTPARYETVTVDSTRVESGKLVISGHDTGGLAAPHHASSLVRVMVGNVEVGRGTIQASGSFEATADLATLDEAMVTARAAPAIVLGEDWEFEGAGALNPSAPSRTTGLAGAVTPR